MKVRLLDTMVALDHLKACSLDSLKEQPVGQRQTLKGFIDHRLAPGIKTVTAFERRLTALSTQVANALALARTRLEMMIEIQNQALLQSMEERARQQVHLSQAVEGLSTAAITYYAIGLLTYVLKALPDSALATDSAIVAMAIPVVALLVWWRRPEQWETLLTTRSNRTLRAR